MDIQLEETGSKHPESLRVDDKTSLSSIDLKEIISDGDKKIPKVRKPYTITKQRERWTEEEHNKFLEALQLYGRGWRRIQEHIGTKTAVQIRSHAQKFFSKVTRESTSSDHSEILKAIEIPPPRPKRKPSHPYPRKLGKSPRLSTPVFKQFGIPSSLMPLLPEQDEGSPTSVLSTLGLDDLQSCYFQRFTDVYKGPVKYSSGSSSQSPVSAVQGSSANLATIEDKYMESYHLPCGKAASQATSIAEVPTIRLFGKNLPLVDPKKPLASSASSTVQDIKTPGLLKVDTQLVSRTTSGNESSSLIMQWCNYTPITSNLVGNLWNSYAGGIPLQPYSFDPPGDNSTSTSTFHLQPQFIRLIFPATVMDPQMNLISYPPSNGIEALSNHETYREGSWIGSITTCHNRITISSLDADAVDSKEAGNLNENK